MDFDQIFTFVLQIFLVTLRVGSVWITFPILSQRNIPNIVKISGAIALSIALLPVAGPHLPHWTLRSLPTFPQILAVVARELLVGLGMGFVAKWVFTSCVASAHWVGMQMGFSAGSILNPETSSQESGWAEFHQWIGILLFMGIGGHWLLIQALADSYQVDMHQAFTAISDSRIALAFWSEVGTKFFVWMLRLSGPMVVVVLLLQAAMGVLSRFVPQINVWLVSLPITIGAGVLVFTFLSPMYGDALGELFKSTNESSYIWLHFLKGGK